MDPSKRQSFTSLLFILNCVSKTLVILKNNSCKFLDTPSVQSGGRGGCKNKGGYIQQSNWNNSDQVNDHHS